MSLSDSMQLRLRRSLSVSVESVPHSCSVNGLSFPIVSTARRRLSIARVGGTVATRCIVVLVPCYCLSSRARAASRWTIKVVLPVASTSCIGIPCVDFIRRQAHEQQRHCNAQDASHRVSRFLVFVCVEKSMLSLLLLCASSRISSMNIRHSFNQSNELK